MLSIQNLLDNGFKEFPTVPGISKGERTFARIIRDPDGTEKRFNLVIEWIDCSLWRSIPFQDGWYIFAQLERGKCVFNVELLGRHMTLDEIIEFYQDLWVSTNCEPMS